MEEIAFVVIILGVLTGAASSCYEHNEKMECLKKYTPAQCESEKENKKRIEKQVEFTKNKEHN